MVWLVVEVWNEFVSSNVVNVDLIWFMLFYFRIISVKMVFFMLLDYEENCL